MPKVFVLPVIRREDYDAFRHHVALNLASTYDQWAKLFADEIAEAIRMCDRSHFVQTKILHVPVIGPERKA
jgi:hypothetical protein